MAQTAKSSSRSFNLVLVKNSKFQDLDVSVDLRAIKGHIDQGGGIVWRALDSKNYYVARYNPLEDNLRLYYVKKGRRIMLKNANLRLNHKAWHTMRVTMLKQDINVFLDGKKYLTFSDKTFAKSGKIGLWSKADSHVYFKAFKASQYNKQH